MVAAEMGMQPNLLPEMSLSEVEKRSGFWPIPAAMCLRANHVRNWMECIEAARNPCSGRSRL